MSWKEDVIAWRGVPVDDGDTWEDRGSRKFGKALGRSVSSVGCLRSNILLFLCRLEGTWSGCSEGSYVSRI